MLKIKNKPLEFFYVTHRGTKTSQKTKRPEKEQNYDESQANILYWLGKSDSWHITL